MGSMIARQAATPRHRVAQANRLRNVRAPDSMRRTIGSPYISAFFNHWCRLMVNPRVPGLFTLLDLRSGGAFSREYRTILRTQWDTPDRVRALQFERLTALLQHAERHVPFYQQRFAEYGVRAADVKDFADFARIPTLSKRDVVENSDRVLSRARRGAVSRSAVGGPTGER